MPNTFVREAVEGGDFGTWATFELAQNRLGLGVITCSLYDDSGTLKLSVGRIGFDNSSNKGSFVLDTIATVSLASVSNANWAKIEVYSTGTSFNITATDISGATDPKSLPTDFTNAYVPAKGGFYIETGKRCIGLVWKNTGGTLEGIVNVFGNQNGYAGYSLSDDANDYRYQHFKTTYEPYKLFSEKREITTDHTVTASTKRKELICKTSDLRIDLPALAGVDEFELTVFNAESDMVTIKPNGAETINGQSYLFLKNEGDLVKIERIDGKWRITNGWLPYFYTGWKNQSDWTNVHLGNAAITYDNLAGTFRIGEKVTGGTNGSYGWIILDSGTVLQVMYLVGGGGNIFENNEVLTGELSGATALVNMGAHLKNVDSNVYHGWGVNNKQIDSRFFISTDGTEANCIYPLETSHYSNFASIHIFTHVFQVDTNNIKFQTGNAGALMKAADDGTMGTVDSDDYYYNILIMLI